MSANIKHYIKLIIIFVKNIYRRKDFFNYELYALEKYNN